MQGIPSAGLSRRPLPGLPQTRQIPIALAILDFRNSNRIAFREVYEPLSPDIRNRNSQALVSRLDSRPLNNRDGPTDERRHPSDLNLRMDRSLLRRADIRSRVPASGAELLTPTQVSWARCREGHRR